MTIAKNPIEDVIHFWFEELSPQDWFVRNDSIDQLIRERFMPLYDVLSNTAPSAQNARQVLGTVIVLDQFPRNLFRGGPRAFATDGLALTMAEHAITAGLDRELTAQQRVFLYMPFQHAESRESQARSVELFTSNGLEQPLDYARRHKEVIDRFGRFPHRNAALGRDSTPAEREFMNHHPGF